MLFRSHLTAAASLGQALQHGSLPWREVVQTLRIKTGSGLGLDSLQQQASHSDDQLFQQRGRFDPQEEDRAFPIHPIPLGPGSQPDHPKGGVLRLNQPCQRGVMSTVYAFLQQEQDRLAAQFGVVGQAERLLERVAVGERPEHAQVARRRRKAARRSCATSVPT